MIEMVTQSVENMECILLFAVYKHSVKTTDIKSIKPFDLHTYDLPHINKSNNSPNSISMRYLASYSAISLSSSLISFYDLHSTSIDTCEIVLRMVHEAALERNAGIIFLG
jgi:hypothetical protein